MDNEGKGKKKSKMCCIYKSHGWGKCSSSDDSSDDDNNAYDRKPKHMKEAEKKKEQGTDEPGTEDA